MNAESRPARRLPDSNTALSLAERADKQGEQLSLEEEAEGWHDWFLKLPAEPEQPVRPKLTRAQRQYLKAEIDRRRREQLARREVRLDLEGAA
jgi:hypothetical protein